MSENNPHVDIVNLSGAVRSLRKAAESGDAQAVPLLAAAESLRTRGSVEWRISVIDVGHDNDRITGGDWTDYSVGAEASGLASSVRGYRWRGRVTVKYKRYGQVVISPHSDCQALVVSRTDTVTRFIGQVVGALFVVAFRDAALVRIGAAALSETPCEDPVTTRSQLGEEAWIRKQLSSGVWLRRVLPAG